MNLMEQEKGSAKQLVLNGMNDIITRVYNEAIPIFGRCCDIAGFDFRDECEQNHSTEADDGYSTFRKLKYRRRTVDANGEQWDICVVPIAPGPSPIREMFIDDEYGVRMSFIHLTESILGYDAVITIKMYVTGMISSDFSYMYHNNTLDEFFSQHPVVQRLNEYATTIAHP